MNLFHFTILQQHDIMHIQKGVNHMIKKWLTDQNPHIRSGKLLTSRDVLYLTNVKNRDEQYIYPLSNICSISYDYAFNLLDANERSEMDVAPMDLIMVVETFRHDKQMFLSRIMEMKFDYFGLDGE